MLAYGDYRKNTAGRYPPPAVIDLARYLSLVVSKILWRIKYRHKENIPIDLEGGLLIVANHQTYLDPFWICAPMRRRFRFMAWNKAFDWFLVGWIIRYLGAFPVDTKRGGVKKVFREALNALRDGATLLMFPEAAREFSDGRMLPFKTGAVWIALEAKVPILPVTVRGGNRVWAQGMKFPRFGSVEIIYHPLFNVSDPPPEADLREYLEQLTAQLTAIIGAPLEDAEKSSNDRK